jgi:pimeloyl-ACP methyl ester carboxylesterase
MADHPAIKGPARETKVSVWNGQINMNVKIAGNGPAVVYFHPAGGLFWDPFLDQLAERYTVYAPELPGTTIGDPYAINKVDDFRDLLLCYDELLEKLELSRAAAIGQSFGGMIACDLAAHFPRLFSKLVLLDAVGLWRDDAPVLTTKMMAEPPEKIPGYLFFDPSIPAAQAMFAPPADMEIAAKQIAGFVWALGCSSKFIWPFPDQGLAKRLHRVITPTLIIWGKEDRLAPVAYAAEFGKRLANARVEILDRCGHLPQVEQLDRTVGLVKSFLGT